MAAIYEEVVVEWEGVEYKLTPTYRLVQRVEQHLSIFSMLIRLDAGESRLSELARLLTFALQEVGCKGVSEEDINARMYVEPGLMRTAIRVLRGFTPPAARAPAGNAPAPAKGAQPTSTGQSTTALPSESSDSPPASSGP
jgi:hypothetical protein